MTRTTTEVVCNESVSNETFCAEEVVETPISFYKLHDREARNFGDENFLRIDWDENLDYAVDLYSDGNQENSYVMILINASKFSSGQEKSTTFYWIDALTDNLISYWKMDEASGNIIDSHGSNDGTTPDTPTYSQDGIIGTSIYFSGDDYFLITSMSSTTQDYTFQFWLNSTHTYTAFGGNLIYSESPIMILTLASFDDYPKLGFYDGTANKAFHNVPNPVTDGNWHHIVYTFDDATSNASVYVDGVFAEDEAYTGSNIGGDVGMGAAYTGSSGFVIQLYMDEVGIWERVLSLSEISSLYNSGDGLAYPFIGADATPPNVTINTPLNQTYTTDIIVFNVSAVDDAGILD